MASVYLFQLYSILLPQHKNFPKYKTSYFSCNPMLSLGLLTCTLSLGHSILPFIVVIPALSADLSLDTISSEIFLVS